MAQRPPSIKKGPHAVPNGNGHPLTWPAIIGAAGLMLGVGGSVVFVGSSLRQIDVNTHRLDTLEQFGSPSVQAIKADLQSTRVSLADLQAISQKGTDGDKQRDGVLFRLDESVRQLTVDVRTLEEFARNTAERRASIVAEVAGIEGRMTAIERSEDDIRNTARRMRDDFTQHQREALDSLQNELNQLQNNQYRTPRSQPFGNGER